MASIKKKTVTRWIDQQTGKRAKPHAPGAIKDPEKSTYYYAKGVPGYPPEYLVPLHCTDKDAARTKLRKLVRKMESRAQGLEAPEEDHDRTPLLTHLEAFRSHLAATGTTPDRVQTLVNRVAKLLKGCDFKTTADIHPLKVKEYLNGLQTPRTHLPPLDPAREQYTRRDLAHALGVKPHCIGPLVRRHGLKAVGVSKGRRYPRETAEALHRVRCQGHTGLTAYYHLREFKTFCRWMVQARRLAENPVVALKLKPSETEVRRGRRTLTQAELPRLLAAARDSSAVYRGLTGNDRLHIYATALGTGFRESELAALLPIWFHLEGRMPYLTLPAREGKNRKPVKQPLPLELAAALTTYLRGRMPTDPIWPGGWSEVGAEMLRVDLDAAGIPYKVQGPDGPLYVDFHSLRHTFVASMDRAGLPLKYAMQLARHSRPELTMKRYGKAQESELAEAVNKLGSLSAPAVAPVAPDDLASLSGEQLKALAVAGLLTLRTSLTTNPAG